MSHMVEIELEMQGPPEALVRALCDMTSQIGRKWTRDDIEVHDVRQPLYGYHGDKRAQEAHVIIRGSGGANGKKNAVGSASNDLGFERKANGKWACHVSEHEVACGYNPDWQKRLLSRWAVQRTGLEAESRGYKWSEASKEVEGKQYVFVTVRA
jgi:Protein of unknown function (DUF1257)